MWVANTVPARASKTNDDFMTVKRKYYDRITTVECKSESERTVTRESLMNGLNSVSMRTRTVGKGMW